MAKENRLKQKPQKVLGEDAAEFIRIFAERYPCHALFTGVELKDDEMIKAAMVQAAEGNVHDEETLLEAYKLQKEKRILDSNQEYALRNIFVERNPSDAYFLDIKEYDQVGEDDIEEYSLNKNLMQSRQYLAISNPFGAWEIGRRGITMTGKRGWEQNKPDDVLIALAESNMVTLAATEPSYFGRLAEIIHNSHNAELGKLVAKTAFEIIEKKERNLAISGKEKFETRDEVEEMGKLSCAFYWGAKRNHDTRMQENARTAYVKYNLRSAKFDALDERESDSELGRLAVNALLESEEHFNPYWCVDRGNGDVAYLICERYHLIDIQDRVREKLVDYSPEDALKYGIAKKDNKLTALARKKLGKKVDEAEIKLFEE